MVAVVWRSVCQFAAVELQEALLWWWWLSLSSSFLSLSFSLSLRRSTGEQKVRRTTCDPNKTSKISSSRTGTGPNRSFYFSKLLKHRHYFLSFDRRGFKLFQVLSITTCHMQVLHTYLIPGTYYTSIHINQSGQQHWSQQISDGEGNGGGGGVHTITRPTLNEAKQHSITVNSQSTTRPRWNVSILVSIHVVQSSQQDKIVGRRSTFQVFVCNLDMISFMSA